MLRLDQNLLIGTIPDSINNRTWRRLNLENQPYVSQNIANQEILANTTTNIDLSNTFADLNEDTITYQAAGLPTGLTIDTNTGIISGQATTDGNFNITITGTDNDGSLNTNFTLNVLANDPEDITYVGTDENDTFTAGNGNDTLDGGLGADTIDGGGGNDTYIVDNSGDVIIEDVNQGNDTVISSINWILRANLENLELTGTSNLRGTGNNLDNILIGNSGNNNLNGRVGADTMIGGAGNDRFYVDNLGDTIIENLNEGTDSVFSTIDYTLGDNLENLTLQGTSDIDGTGNNLNNRITGNNGNNILTGGDGNDNLNGKAGADTFFGGVGNDRLSLGNNDDAVDVVNYSFGDGTDRVSQFTIGVGGDQIQFTDIADIDVVVSRSNTQLRVGDGIADNADFGTGDLLITLSRTSGLTAANVDVNLFGADFLFS